MRSNKFEQYLNQIKLMLLEEINLKGKVMNECEGCPVFEDGFKSKEMCYMCDIFVN